MYQADTGDNDDGAEILTELRTAFSYFRSRGIEKRFAMVRPVFEAETALSPALLVNVDFKSFDPEGGVEFEAAAGAVWDAEQWDVAMWGGLSITHSWKSAGGIGVAASLAIGIDVNAGEVYLDAIDWKYELARSAGYI